MKIPEESLDDFVVNPAPEIINEPPPPVWLRSTGEVEVLKPLARREVSAKAVPLRPAFYGLSWFHRSIAFGGVAAMIALIFASAIIIGINDPLAEMGGSLADTFDDTADMAMYEESVETPRSNFLPTDEPLSSDSFMTTSLPVKFDGRRAVRTNARRSLARPTVPSTAAPVRRQPIPAQLVVSQFVPSTLVIFLENGEIKTRIEPQLTAGHNKPTTLSN